MEPKEALKRLKEGNKAYVDAKSNPGDISLALRKETSQNGQHPYACIICCSDSRVIPEAIFSCGIGELFVIRVAGNVASEEVIGSVEYATSHLGTKLVVVLGHSQCGAVTASVEGGAHGYVKSLTDRIMAVIQPRMSVEGASKENTKAQAQIIAKALNDEKTSVIAAYYDVSTGVVSPLD